MYIVALKSLAASSTSTPPIFTAPSPPSFKTPTPSVPPTLPPIVLPSGGGSCSGTAVSPGQSLSSAISSLGSGQTLCVHGGTYGKLTVTIPSGATVKAFPGEKPWVEGLSSITGSSGSVMDGINFRWGSDSYGPHMVSMKGSGWTYINGEIGPSHGYANVLVSGGASNFRIANCYIHDNTNGGHTDVQDHLIYVSEASSGIIERCLFINSPRGRGIKMGPPDGSGGPKNITIRYNTFYNNLGPSNMQVSGDTSGVKMYRNILVKSGASTNITDATNSKSGNSAYENVGDGSGGVAASSLGTGNIKLDPQLDSNFRPTNPAAAAYGRYAP
ncbi:MAG: right-handed parallel beta-helix repeat-containing protein [bacterium]|nr:right-handed parallel beta-helix repeat-containing protein [bacterium]